MPKVIGLVLVSLISLAIDVSITSIVTEYIHGLYTGLNNSLPF